MKFDLMIYLVYVQILGKTYKTNVDVALKDKATAIVEENKPQSKGFSTI